MNDKDNEIIFGGCILLSRQILQSEIWKKPPEWLKIFIYILLKVNHENSLFPRGSNFFNFSEQIPAGVSYNQVQAFLKWAASENIQILTKQKTTRGMIIKVNNYDKYQTFDNYKNPNEKLNRNQIETKQELNRNQTINKNERMKECNNVNNSIGKKEKEFIPPTVEEIKKYCEERKNSVDAQKFYDYYNVSNWKDSKGKPIRNWKQKIIAVWEKSNKGENTPPAQKKSNSSRSAYGSCSSQAPNAPANAENFYMSLSK